MKRLAFDLGPSTPRVAGGPLSSISFWVTWPVITGVIIKYYPSHDRFVKEVAVQNNQYWTF